MEKTGAWSLIPPSAVRKQDISEDVQGMNNEQRINPYDDDMLYVSLSRSVWLHAAERSDRQTGRKREGDRERYKERTHPIFLWEYL